MVLFSIYCTLNRLAKDKASPCIVLKRQCKNLAKTGTERLFFWGMQNKKPERTSALRLWTGEKPWNKKAWTGKFRPVYHLRKQRKLPEPFGVLHVVCWSVCKTVTPHFLLNFKGFVIAFTKVHIWIKKIKFLASFFSGDVRFRRGEMRYQAKEVKLKGAATWPPRAARLFYRFLLTLQPDFWMFCRSDSFLER